MKKGDKIGTEEKFQFRCPICDCTEYLEYFEDNGMVGPGYETKRIFYYCAGCTVPFLDPKAFTVKLTRRKK